MIVHKENAFIYIPAAAFSPLCAVLPSTNKFKNTTYVLKWKDNNHRHENSLDCLVQKLLCTAWFILSTLAIVRLKSVCMIVIVHISTHDLVESAQSLFVSSLLL